MRFAAGVFTPNSVSGCECPWPLPSLECHITSQEEDFGSFHQPIGLKDRGEFSLNCKEHRWSEDIVRDREWSLLQTLSSLEDPSSYHTYIQHVSSALADGSLPASDKLISALTSESPNSFTHRILTRPFYGRLWVNLIVKGYLEGEGVIKTKGRLGKVVCAFNHRLVDLYELGANLVNMSKSRTAKGT